jgi:endoglucanase
MIKSILSLLLCCASCLSRAQPALSWIRINQLGYPPAGVKAAVLGSHSPIALHQFELVNAVTGKTVWELSNRTATLVKSNNRWIENGHADFK